VNRGSSQNSPDIHPTAIVDPGARLAPGVRVGPYSIIGPHVTLGENTIVHGHVTIVGHTTVGTSCEFYSGCVIGEPPQDLKYRGEPTRVLIGDFNVFREQVTAHPGTAGGGGVTSVGNHNLFMIGMHIGHDVRIGSHCIFANLCLLAGHVLVEDFVTVGGHVGIHHFTTVGKHAMIGGMTKVAADVPPFLLTAGTRNSRQEVRMVNGVGLKRCGLFTEAQIRALKEAYMRLFSRSARQGPIVPAIHQLKAESADSNVHYLCDFLLRSFECGRHGRYLESLRPASQPVSRPPGVDDAVAASADQVQRKV
jgi:UDP-N-acetylglucosamine acyltransferase